jgi:RNA polymerase sigma-70 factor (ECF subfamily)
MAVKKHLLFPDTWVDRYSNYLFNYTISRVNDREIAKDLISETFLAGLKSKDNFKGEATERTWLISILKRKIIDYYRKINSQKGKAEVKMNYVDNEQEGDWMEERVADAGESTVGDLENSELGMAIDECLGQINPRHAEIFKMRTIDEFDTEVVCKEFDISPSNLWVIIHRARVALSKCLKKNWLN